MFWSPEDRLLENVAKHDSPENPVIIESRLLYQVLAKCSFLIPSSNSNEDDLIAGCPRRGEGRQCLILDPLRKALDPSSVMYCMIRN